MKAKKQTAGEKFARSVCRSLRVGVVLAGVEVPAEGGEVKTMRVKGTMWGVRENRAVLVTVLGWKRAWCHLRSGGHEWKEQNPKLFAFESQALWYCMEQEIQHAFWWGWDRAREGVGPYDEVHLKRTTERLFDFTRQYTRAWVREMGSNLPRDAAKEA